MITFSTGIPAKEDHITVCYADEEGTHTTEEVRFVRMLEKSVVVRNKRMGAFCLQNDCTWEYTHYPHDCNSICHETLD